MVAAHTNGDAPKEGKRVFSQMVTTLVDAASDPANFSNDGDRMEALLAAYNLVSKLETPWETVLRLVMGQVRKPRSRQISRPRYPADAGVWHA